MGSIHLTLNIDRVDLVIAIGVAVIALMIFIGLIAWFVKSGRRNRTLKQIDSKLSPQQCEYIEYLTKQVKTERKKTDKTPESTEPLKEKDVKEADIEGDDEYDGPDVMEEIRKMMMEDRDSPAPVIGRKPGNTAKSGRVYSREEIENLIDD